MKHAIAITAVLFCAAAPMAYAQDNSTTTTTTVETPNTVTTTKTTRSADGFTEYRRTVTATKSYDVGPFHAPSGYVYSRYVPGDHVPVLLVRSGDFDIVAENYALTSPPEGLKWIRVGDDGLLVARDTGEVIAADYRLFRG